MSLELLTVGFLAAIDLWLALPAAFAMPIPSAVSATVMAVGGSIGSAFAAIGARKINLFIESRYSKYDPMVARTSRVMNQYGIPGIGLTAPVILGPLLTTVIAIVLGADAKRVLLWIIVGTVVWCLIFYLALILG